MQARKARARMIRIVTWGGGQMVSMCVCFKVVMGDCKYVVDLCETGLGLHSEKDGGCAQVCVCSYNK